MKTHLVTGISVVFAAVAVCEEPRSVADFVRRAEAGERLSVVWFGGSLTWGANASDPNRTSLRALVSKRLEETYPKAHFRFKDAAIGGAVKAKKPVLVEVVVDSQGNV